MLITNVKEKVFFKKNKIKDLSQYIINQSIYRFPDINFLKKYNLTHKNKKNKKIEFFLSIDSHHDHNNWKEYNFIKLTEKLLRIKKVKFIYINFSPNKIKRFRKILEKFENNKKIIFTHKSRFNQIMNIINNCSIIIGNESGPACLGASLGKNVFSIYDPKYTPNLSSKIINKKIKYFNSKKLKADYIIKKVVSSIN